MTHRVPVRHGTHVHQRAKAKSCCSRRSDWQRASQFTLARGSYRKGSSIGQNLGEINHKEIRDAGTPAVYLLALVAAAVAAGQTTVLAMSAWAEQHAAERIATLQPACLRIPSAATWRRLVVHSDIAALKQQVAAHNQALDAADATIGSVAMRNGQIFRGQAVDGKDIRGASAHGAHTFLVSWVRHEHAYVLRQAAVARKTNEITVVPELLTGRNLTGTVTTLDALLTPQRLAQQILAQGGHYLMIVKQNQPALYEQDMHLRCDAGQQRCSLARPCCQVLINLRQIQQSHAARPPVLAGRGGTGDFLGERVAGVVQPARAKPR